jgi:GxxExxY protein
MSSVDGRKLIGYDIPDFVVENRIIVEIKALPGLDDSHIAQVIGYLAVSGCEAGLLINFGQRSMEWQRVLPPKKVQEHKVNRQWLFVPDWLRGE